MRGMTARDRKIKNSRARAAGRGIGGAGAILYGKSGDLASSALKTAPPLNYAVRSFSAKSVSA